MRQDIRYPLSWFFTVWLVVGNAMWWWGPESLEQVLGDGALWAIAIPLGCIACIHPRRSIGALLAGLASMALLLGKLLERSGKQRPRSQATPV